MFLSGEKIVVIKDTTCTTCVLSSITDVDIFEISCNRICIINTDPKSVYYNINHLYYILNNPVMYRDISRPDHIFQNSYSRY